MQGDCKMVSLTLHLESHSIQGTPEDRPRATRAPNAKVPNINMNLTDQEWERWKSKWLRSKRSARPEDYHYCMFNI